MKYRIEKDSVQETLLIPLYGRKMAMESYPDLFKDQECQRLLERIEFDASPMTGIKAKIGALIAATRQYDLAEGCRQYLKNHPRAAAVNLGCGLDTMLYQVGNGKAVVYSPDFTDVIRVRNELLPPEERETNIPCDLNDLRWMDSVSFQPENGAVFFNQVCFTISKRRMSGGFSVKWRSASRAVRASLTPPMLRD